MATDYWPQEEGYIVEGSPVMMCKTAGTITEMACVLIQAGGAGYVQVDHSAAAGDSVGVALRACTVTGQMIPVAFGGIVKMLADSSIAVMEPVQSAGSDTAKVVDGPASNVLFINNSNKSILGIALQAGVTDGDEILVLLSVH